MFSFKDKVLYFSLFNAVGYIWALVQIPEAEDDDIATTEMIIRNTVNNIFANFRVRDVKHRPRLKDFSVIHNFFVSMTLKDCDNLKEIARLTRVNNIDNNTNHLITQINEVLNEGDKSNEEADDVYVTKHIETFINKLRRLKEIHRVNEDFGNFSINEEILKILNSEDPISSNLTDEVRYGNDSDEKILADFDIWTPVQQSGRRIFDGHRTRIKYYPFVATIQFFEKFQCAGSIIRRDLVITAASCLQLAWNNRFFRENPAFLSVQVGCDYYEAGGENIAVLDVFFHPDYQPNNLNNNLALLRLGTNIVFSKKITNVKRIFFDRRASPLPSNTDGIIILGWGARDSSNIMYGPWRNRLSHAELDIYPLRECQEIYSKQYVTYKNFCAGFFSKGTGACSHDVGGPGVSGGILLGVISFGPPICGTPDAPTVFTKIGYYSTWIDQIMKQQVSRIVRLSTKRRSKSTFALHYSDTTRPHFTVKPIDKGEHMPGYIPIPTGAGSLRILKDDKIFKQFMSTMFQSREAKDYASPPSVDDDTCEDDDEIITQKPKHKSKSKKNKGRSQILPPNTANLDENENDMDNTKTHAANVKQNKKYHSINKEGRILTDKKANSEDDSELNDDIKNLLDDLDLYKLLNSEEVIMNSDDNDDIAARALEIVNPAETNIDKKKTGKKAVQKLPHAPSRGKNKNKKIKHKSVKKMPLSLQNNKGRHDKARKISTATTTQSVTKAEISDNEVKDESVQNLLYSETVLNMSDNGTDTRETVMDANGTIQNQLYLSDKDDNSNELLEAEEKISGALPNLSENEQDTNENMTALDKSVENELHSSENNETLNSKEQQIFYKARDVPTATLSNVDDNEDSDKDMETTNRPILRKPSYKKGTEVNENDEENQKAEETSLNFSDADEDTNKLQNEENEEEDEEEITTSPFPKLSKSVKQAKNANNIDRTTTGAIQTTLESSENDDETQSDEDDEESEDNSGLSIADEIGIMNDKIY